MSDGAATFSEDELTDDAFLGGQLQLLQPIRGYRAATDPVLLAAACDPPPGAEALDVGSGAGAAAFCLAWRRRDLVIEGVEMSAPYAALSERNAARNGLAWRVHRADIRAAPAELKARSFDLVLTNPPFYAGDANPRGPDPLRDAAKREAAGLGDWLDFCLRRLKPKGALALIHRIERLPEIFVALHGRAGDIVALPLEPRPGRPAQRVLVKARKEGRGAFRLAPPLALHGATGKGFAPAVEAALREGAPLDF